MHLPRLAIRPRLRFRAPCSILTIPCFGAQQGSNGQLAALQSSYNLLIYIVAVSLHFTARSLRLLNKQLTLNQRVPGSSPGAPTTRKPAKSGMSDLFRMTCGIASKAKSRDLGAFLGAE